MSSFLQPLRGLLNKVVETLANGPGAPISSDATATPGGQGGQRCGRLWGPMVNSSTRMRLDRSRSSAETRPETELKHSRFEGSRSCEWSVWEANEIPCKAILASKMLKKWLQQVHVNRCKVSKFVYKARCLYSHS